MKQTRTGLLVGMSDCCASSHPFRAVYTSRIKSSNTAFCKQSKLAVHPQPLARAWAHECKEDMLPNWKLRCGASTPWGVPYADALSTSICVCVGVAKNL
ncbi:MAG: hypothetical protein ACKOW3_09605 [Hyphomicrobium sp.]